MSNSLRLLKCAGLLLVLFFSATVAQPINITEVISIRDGLSSNAIRDIIQDKYGYIWIATNDGVNIYDGYKITVLKNIPGDSTSLPSNNAWRLLQDKQGIIWISTDEGLAKYDRRAHTFKVYRPNVTSGIYGNTIVHLYEDSRDNFWVSTLIGAHIFDRDKETFQSFDVMQTDNSIAVFANQAGNILETAANELYTTSEGFGLLKFDYDASLFVQVPLKDNFNERIKLNQYIAMITDSEDNLWIGVSSGLLKVNLKDKTGDDLTPFKKVTAPKFNMANAASGLFMDRNKNIWVGTMRDGLFLYDSKSKAFEQITSGSSTYFYRSFYEDNSGVLWFGSSRGVMKYDFDRKPFATYEISDKSDDNISKNVLSFSPSLADANRLWLATNQGLYQFDKQNNSIKKGSVVNNRLAQLATTEISGVLEAHDGMLWLSTSRDGLYSYNISSGLLKNFRSIMYDNTTLKNNGIHSMELDKKGNLWVGTHEGLNFLGKNARSFIPIPSFLTRTYETQILEEINQLREKDVPVCSIIKVGDYADLSKEFVQRKDGKILIYAMGEGLAGWNMVDFGWLESSEGDTLWSGQRFNETFHASGALKNRIKIDLLDLKAGRYKLRYKSDDSHSVESYNTTPPQDSLFWGSQIFSITDDTYNALLKQKEISEKRSYSEGEDCRVVFCDSKNNIWLGTDNGLSRIDSTMFIQNFYKKTGDPNSLSNNFVRDIKEDFNGYIWIATADGLNKLDPLTGAIAVIREIDGLPSSNLSAIEVDNQGHLWISGLKGISKIELDSLGRQQIIVNYDVKDGLQGYEFTVNASFKDNDGKLYFAGADGFNSFYPGNSNRTPPLLAIQDFKVLNKSVGELEDLHFSDLTQLSVINLAHDQNDLSFEFASIHFSRPDKNRLVYKMDGVDESWQIGDRRFASYTNLNPGDYTFNLRGSNGDGIWSEETRSIYIHIAAPWYNNGWAYSIYTILFFGLLFSIRQFEMGRQEKNAKIKESQLRAEAAELKAQAAEAQAQVVQAENERKSRELEEARSLQLSMLPKELPQLPHMDIAVYMQTATEVGGDYYDFHVALDGTLTVVIGDATGHGMKAGTMVTTAKSLFNSYAPNPDILFSFQEITRCIKQMNFDKLSMCLTMVKIKGNKMQMSSAGMPPSFIFRRDTRVVEEHLFKAMPLGTMDKFPYEIKDTTLGPGDTILLISDGLPELKNKDGKLYSYKKVRNIFEDVAEQSPEEIIRVLKDEGTGWIDNADPDDDVTFVVLKMKA